MVFESIVVDLVNRYLGDFIENLDASQLKIGLWGGDVVLQNLKIKANALSDLDLPLQIVHGRLGKLVMKIPWNNLYRQPVLITLDGLYLFTCPTAEAKYDEAKEEKMNFDTKLKELGRIEASKKPILSKAEKPDSFTEKLATQIIKNLQISIENIHICYEDNFVRPDHPFCFGITLRSLNLSTTDQNWNPMIIEEQTDLIFKLISLESFAIYWNSDCNIQKDSNQIQLMLQKTIVSSSNPVNFNYILLPVTSKAKLKMVTRPQKYDYKISKLTLDVEVADVQMQFSRLQYIEVIELLETRERMMIVSQFRKYGRPQKMDTMMTWWKYVTRCIVGEYVRRRRDMWSWEKMKAHKALREDYRDAYVKKLKGQKLPQNLLTMLETGERELSIFNISLARQQAEIQVQQEGKAIVKPSGGWFSGWWGSGADSKASDIGTKFEMAMSAEQKKELYQAIGYEENAGSSSYPPEFISNQIRLHLSLVSLKLLDSKSLKMVEAGLHNSRITFSQRPTSFLFTLQLESLQALGGDHISFPSLIIRPDQTQDLMDVAFEANPLNSDADYRMTFKSSSLKIVYHADTVNKALEFFKPPESLSQLEAAAAAKFEQLKEQTATGLQHTIDQHKQTNVSIDIQPSSLILPKRGYLHADCELVLLQMGHLRISSIDVDRSSSADEKFTMDVVKSRAYDRFSISLSEIQVLMARAGEDDEFMRDASFLLRPTSILLKADKSIIADPNIPKLLISGELPDLSLSISTEKLKSLCELLSSVDWPNASTTDRKTEAIDLVREDEKCPELDKSKSSASMLKLKFEITKFAVSLHEHEEEVSVFALQRVGTCIEINKFDLFAAAYIGSLDLAHKSESGMVKIISTLALSDEDEKLLSVKFVQAEERGPEFASRFNSTLQNFKVRFASVQLYLELRALLDMMRLVEQLKIAAQRSGASTTKPASIKVKSDEKKSSTGVVALGHETQGDKKMTVTILAVDAQMELMRITFAQSDKIIMDLHVKGLSSGIVMSGIGLSVSAGLRDLSVDEPGAIHPQIISIRGSNVFKLTVKSTPALLAIKLNTGQMNVVFHNLWVSKLQTFLQNFNTGRLAISEASNALVEQASEHVTTEQKMSLDIQLQAPVIVVPRNSRSKQAISFDLGSLTITSSQVQEGQEHFSLDLKELKITRLGNSILEPVNMNFEVDRVIGNALQMEISGKTNSISVCLDSDDYCVMMKILEENLQEKEDLMASDRPFARTEAVEGAGLDESSASDQESEASLATQQRINFSFVINAIIGALYSEPGARDATQKLSEFRMENLSVNFAQDETMSVETSITSMTLKDTRPSSQGHYTRGNVIKPRMSVSAPAAPLILFKMKQSEDASTKIDVLMESLVCVFSMEYVLQLSEFFSQKSPALEDRAVHPDLAARQMSGRSVDRNDDSVQGKTGKGRKGELVMEAAVKTLEVILIENQADMDTAALLLHMDLMMRLRVHPDQSELVLADVSQLQIFACQNPLDEVLRSKKQIISPLNISLLSNSPQGMARHVDVRFTEVHAFVSATVIRIAAGCLAAFASKQVEEEEKEESCEGKLWGEREIDKNLWFLQAATESTTDAVAVVKGRSEMMLFSMDKILVKLAVSGDTLLTGEMSLQAQLNDWSSQLSASMDLTMGLMCFNEAVSCFEPLLEPLQLANNSHQPWGITMQLTSEEGRTVYSLTSDEIFNLTISKNALAIMSRLSQSFSKAYNLDSSVMVSSSGVGLLLTNETGIELGVRAPNFSQRILPPEGSVQLAEIPTKFIVDSAALGFTRLVRPNAQSSAIRLSNIGYPGEPWTILCQASTVGKQRKLLLTSVLQIKNTLPMPVSILYDGPSGSKKIAGTAAMGEALNIPLAAMYAGTKRLYVQPDGHEVSVTAICWKQSESGCCISCFTKENSSTSIYISIMSKEKKISLEDSDEVISCSTLLLCPALKFVNLLPVKVCVQTVGSCEVASGCTIPLLHTHFQSSYITAKVVDYCGQSWSCNWKFSEAIKRELNFCGAHKGNLTVSVDVANRKDMRTVTIYSPFWMINQTEKQLRYKGTVIAEHPSDLQPVCLFSPGNVKKAMLSLDGSDWSSGFSLEAIGSSGVVTCSLQQKDEQVAVDIRLSEGGFTKIITFRPLFSVVNNADFDILIKQNVPSSTWIPIKSGQGIGYWPDKALKMMAKVGDVATKPFPMNCAHSTLLPLHNNLGGLHVECQMLEASVVIRFHNYQRGHATALLVNATQSTSLSYQQSGEKMYRLEAGQMALYTWQDPAGERVLIWKCEQVAAEKNKLVEDLFGQFKVKSGPPIFWLSFLDGPQRVLLWTDKNAIFQQILPSITGQTNVDTGLSSQSLELKLNMRGIGLSLVNDELLEEVLYASITSSKLHWEKKGKRWKPVDEKLGAIVEEAYQLWLSVTEVTEEIISHCKYNFKFSESACLVVAPVQMTLRRSFQYGVELSFSRGPNQTAIHAKVHHVQIDSQLRQGIFPIVLAPVAPPKSVMMPDEKPFIELSAIITNTEHSSVLQYKYTQVLVQEMALKIDQVFLYALLDVFSFKTLEPAEGTSLTEKDLAKARQELVESESYSTQLKHHYNYLHVSPLKVNLSFSMYGGDAGAGISHVLLQSVGVVLSDMQDVLFKLGYFERRHCFMNQNELTQEIFGHYRSQALKQMYLVVLGLDVLGNPVGVIRGIADGIEDLFYEPYQGAIQGPQEFVEGMAVGVRSLLGHTVGGAAGAVSKITGTLGKGIATLSLDEDYQKKRQEKMANKPRDLKEGLAQGGYGLITGVFDGVTGIVRKPISGAQQHGVSGFFKGLGKGLAGVVTRPAGGVVDFASSSFEGIKRSTEVSERLNRVRPPRLLRQGRGICPYNLIEAEGNQILSGISTDDYINHFPITANDVLFVSNQKLIFASKGDFFGSWNIEWSYAYSELKEPPTLCERGLQILLRVKEKKNIFKSSSVGKIVSVTDQRMAQRMLLEIKLVMDQVC